MADVSDEAVAALQAALDHFRRRIAELTAAGIPEDEALRHIVNAPPALPSVPGFNPGDKVWPKEGPVVLQHAPQTVIATYRHPVAGDWLWLEDGNCGFGSWTAKWWTTEEPDDAEKESRMVRRSGSGGVAFAPDGFAPILPVPVPDAMEQYDELRKRRGEGMHTPLRSMLDPEAIALPAGSGDLLKFEYEEMP